MIVTVKEHDKNEAWILVVELHTFNTYTATCNICLKRPMLDTMTLTDDGVEGGSRIIRLDNLVITNHLFEIDIQQNIKASIKFTPETALDRHIINHSDWDKEIHTDDQMSFAIKPFLHSQQAVLVENFVYTNTK